MKVFLMFVLTVSVTVNAQVTPFTMVVTPVDETCTGNGQFIIDIDNTETGAEFEFTIYESSNLVTPIRVESTTATGTTLQHTISALPSGTYHVIVTQTVGIETNQQEADVTIASNIENLAFTLSQEPLCSGADITVNVTAGNPDTYELYDTSNTLVTGPQASNIFSSVAAGDYTVVVTDVCGNSTSLGVTVTDDPAVYGIQRNNGIYGFWTKEDCNTIRHIEKLQYNGGNNIPVVRFPIDVVIEIQDPFGGPNTVINSTWTSNADNSQLVLIPFHDGQSYDYTVTYTDACGVVTTRTDTINATPSTRLRQLVANCGTKFLRMDLFRYHFAPVEVAFTAYPTGFDPADYNTDFTPGAYSNTYNTLPNAVLFGDASSVGVPEGNYTIETTSCGRTEIKNFTIVNNVSYSINVRRYYSGCGDNEGSVNFYIKTSSSSAQADNLVSVNITSAPAEFVTNYGALPYDVSYNIASNGQFYMNSLPAGDYTVEGIGECGLPATGSFTIYDKIVTSTVTPAQNCGSFNVSASISSYLGNEVMWLQKYYPALGQWGHPTTGTLYTEGNQIGSTTGMQINGSNNNSGYQTVSGTLNNIAETGHFRVVVQSVIHSNGISNNFYCRETLDTFNTPSNGISLNNYYVANCTSGNTELVIDAIGVPPLNYSITEFDGAPLTIDNGTDPVFSELAPGEYTVEIDDSCGNTAVFTFKTDEVKAPVIVPDNLCDGETGKLFINGLSFLDIEWTKDADPTVIATGNTLTFNPYSSATDEGTYYATLTDPSNPSSCFAQTLSFTVTDPQLAQEAGTGQTVDILQQNVGLINLFDYDTAPYDNWGTWTDLSNTGTLNNEVWDASTMTVGTYQFEYNVGGTCSGNDTTVVTINIIASDLITNQDDLTSVCPFEEELAIGNVMDNDTEFSNPVVQANYTISEETPDPEGILSVNADGTVDIAAGSFPGQTYTLEYRITENANTNNYAIGTLNVTIAEDTTPPVITCPADVEILSSALDLSGNYGTATATDECGNTYVSYTDVVVTGDCATGDTIQRTWYAYDDSGNYSTCVQNIVFKDDTPPTITCPADITVECGDSTEPIDTGEATYVADNVPLLAEINYIGTNSYGGTQIVTTSGYRIGQSFTATSTGQINEITIMLFQLGASGEDHTLDLYLDADPGNGNIISSPMVTNLPLPKLGGGFQDADGNPSTPPVLVPGPGPTNSYPVTFKLPAPFMVTAGQLYRIELTSSDNTSKVAWMSEFSDINSGGGRVFDGVQDALDYFFETTIYSTQVDEPVTVTHNDVETITCGNAKTIERTWTATDECGLFTECVQTITVQDTTAPVFVEALPADATVECDAVPAADVLTATDTCGAATVSFNETTTAGSCPNSYTLTREWTATDACGLTTVHTQTITVQDTTAPVFVEALPADVTVECDAVPVAETLTATDTCGTATVTFAETRTDGACPSSYTLARTWTATDECGLTTVHTQTITVEDTTPPTFVEALPADATVACDAVPVAETLTATDTCGTATVTFAETRTDGACPSSYTLARTWTATDECGLTTVHTQTITVEDTTPPTFNTTPPTDAIEVACTEDIPAAATITATDSCGDATVYVDELRTDGACFGQYTIERRWVAIDTCGNQTVSDPQIITVNDVTGPTFNETLPADITLECTDTIPDAVELTATDCTNPINQNIQNLTNDFYLDMNKIISNYDSNNSGFGTIFSDILVTDILEDGVSQDVIDYFNGVTVSLTTEAVSGALNPRVRQNNVGFALYNGKITLTFSEPITFQISGNPTLTSGEKLTFSGDGNQLYPFPGSPGVNFFGDQNIVTTLTSPYIVYNSGDVTVQNSAQVFGGRGTSLIAQQEEPTSSIAQLFVSVFMPGESNIPVTFDEEIVEGSCANNYEIVRNWTATDVCGNETVHTQTITVEDTTAPTFVESLPTDVTVECNAVPVAETLTATDNCGTATVTFVETTTAGSCPNSYTLTREWTATDDCGNEAVHIQRITVQDTTVPVIAAAPADTTIECIDDLPAAMDLAWTDNCDAGGMVTSVDGPLVGTACGGTITRTWNVADACGNNAVEVSQVFTIEDTQAPQLVSTLEDIDVECDAIPSVPTLEFTDNCSSTVTQTSFEETSTFDGSDSDYTITRTWTVADDCGNVADFTQYITVTVKTSVTEIADSRCIEDGTIDLNDYLATQSTGGIWEVTQGSVTLSDGGIFDPSGLNLGDYIFTYTSSNSECLIATRVTININDDCVVLTCSREDVVISKAVTPNGDSWNEFFEVTGVESCGFITKVQIFNRWGARVYESNNYANNWNGVSDGSTFGGAERLPAGTYYYIVILENSGLKPFTGAIYLGTK
ncbi:gliding motility-associated C-terminal domain-containing protein [Tenacibaculum sp. 47A_GOM-205m]|uniref:gliding motility-associated C-terminal domain-containing protein n=1 Tax=Tenacibaculum sp. 47A_GOM-205m TaxID=1380384 RepID=UPI00048F1B3D|nr:T9SS C-terminal target domain-containing protein [Tenacibaculum sp. 47A_GOM-205m]